MPFPHDLGPREVRTALALELELARGRHGASARLEVLEGPTGALSRVARVILRGWIGGAAERRFERAFHELVACGVQHVVVDCTAVRHVGERVAHRLVSAVARAESDAPAVEVWGLPGRLSRRLDGPRVRCWPGSGEDSAIPSLEPGGECAS